MRKLANMDAIQIEVTNNCMLECCHCTRFSGHHRKNFFAELSHIEKSLDSLKGFKGQIGVMGGEPLLHPHFRDICKLYREKIPDIRQRGLWTAGMHWDKYKDDIKETFLTENILYNDHSNPTKGKHQPLLIAIDEVIEDKDLMWKTIDNCWVNLRWSASITPKGAFFCEVAAAQDWLFSGPGGWKIEPGWWKRDISEYKEQMRSHCVNCSACLPYTDVDNHYFKDLISLGNAKRLEQAKSPKFARGQYIIVDTKEIYKTLMNRNFTATPGSAPGSFSEFPEWKPWCFRPEKFFGPGEGKLTYQETLKLQRGNLSFEDAIAIQKSRAND